MKLEEQTNSRQEDMKIEISTPVDDEDISIKIESNECDSGEIESIIKIEPEVMEDFVHEPDDEDTRIIPYMPAKGLMVDHRKSLKSVVVTLRVMNEAEISQKMKENGLTMVLESDQTMITGKKKGRQKCDLCCKIFLSRASLMNHIKLKHWNERNYFCDHCPASFLYECRLKVHMMSKHLRTDPFSCNDCDYRTSNKSSLSAHKLRHGRHTECQICHKSVPDIKTHLQRKHARKIPCHICGNIVHELYMKQHINRSHVLKINKHKCSDCSEAFDDKRDLEKHITKAHYKGATVECHCGLVFKRKKAMLEHQRIDHNATKENCTICSKAFRNREVYRVHWKKHHEKVHGSLKTIRPAVLTLNGPYTCDFCQKLFSVRINFINHLTSNHIKPHLICDLCPKSFKAKYPLMLHMQSCHARHKTFLSCNVCDHKTLTNKSLQIHLKIHGKKEKCPECHKLVTNLKNHAKSHLDRVTCKICGMKLKTGSIFRHMRRHKEEMK